MGRKRNRVRVLQAQRKTEGVPLNDPKSAAVFSPPPGARVPVSETTALNLSAVWAAVRVITGSISVLPLHVYRKGEDGDRVDAPDSLPAVRIAKSPNPEMSPVTFWETLSAHALTWGNCYAEIERDGHGDALAIWPVAPNAIRPRRDERSGELYYETWALGRMEQIPARDILHVPGLGFDGVQGYSVISMARRSLGLAATAEEAGASFFADGMRPGGVLKYPGTLADLQKLNLEEGVKAKYAGASKFGKALVLYGGLEWEKLGIPPHDAQFLETREFQTEEVARWFNIPPHKLRDLRRATFSNIEHQGQEFVTDSLLYWLTKIAQEFGRKLLPVDRPGLYAEHVTDALLKGDTLSRYTAYGLGRQWGFLSPNDIRRRENMRRIEGGDVYHVPVNMARLGAEGSQPVGQPSTTTEPKPDDGTGKATVMGIAVGIARELADCDAAELEKAVERSSVPEWVAAKSRPGAWGWVAEVIQNRCVTIGTIYGRQVDPRKVATAVESVRRHDVGLIRSNVDAAAMAACWRDGLWSLAELIVRSLDAQ